MLKKLFVASLIFSGSVNAYAQSEEAQIAAWLASNNINTVEELEAAGGLPEFNELTSSSNDKVTNPFGSKLSYDVNRYPAKPVQISVGTVAHGVTDMAVNSDYPGPWRGRLTHPIYSQDQRYVIFPEGSIITGTAQRATGVNEAIHNRMIFKPAYITRPDGLTVDISSLSILDRSGIAGLTDKVDRHLDVQAAAIGGYSISEALPKILEDAVLGDKSGSGETAVFETQSRALKIIEKYLELVPTVEIRPGEPFRIFFTAPAELPPVEPRFPMTNLTGTR